MLEDRGVTSANPVVTLALARNDEANTKEPPILRRVVGKSQVFAPRRPDIAFATNRLARSLATLTKADRIEMSLALSLWHAGSWLGAADTQRSVRDTTTVFHDSNWTSDRPMRKYVSSR